MRRTILTGIGALVLTMSCNGCSPANTSPDAIRKDTAATTATAVRDAKAMVQGIVEGLRTKGPVNINRASKSELITLPGIDNEAAERIIANRPYKDSSELYQRRLISHREYDRIADQIAAQ